MTIRRLTAILMLCICGLTAWGGVYFLATTGLDSYSKIILFGMPLLGCILTVFYLLNRISAGYLLLPIALAYIINAFRP